MKRDCTIYVAKTKALISFPFTAKLICVFVFAYAKSLFYHDAAHIVKLGFTGVFFFFSFFFALKHRLWVPIRTASVRQF